MKNLTDEELVLLYQAGKQEAFNEIYLRYKNLVKYFCRNLYLLGAEESDLIQEGMLGLIKGVNGYKESTTSFKTYVTTCIKTSLFTAVKKYAGNKSFPLNSSINLESLDKLNVFSPPPDEQVCFDEENNDLLKILNSKLSKFEMKILKLYLEGFSYQEIALKLGKNEKAIENALSRSRLKLRRIKWGI